MNHSTPGIPVHHQLPYPTQIHVPIYRYMYIYICICICVIYIYTHTHTHNICWHIKFWIFLNQNCIKIFWHRYVLFWEHIFLTKYKKSPCLIEIWKWIFRWNRKNFMYHIWKIWSSYYCKNMEDFLIFIYENSHMKYGILSTSHLKSGHTLSHEI